MQKGFESRIFLRGEVLYYNRAKMNSFILKCLENSQENQPITPKFVPYMYIVYMFVYTTVHYTNNPWICRYRFNGKVFLIFFCITPRTRKIKKKYSRVSYIHVSKNILKMIKQRNQARQVLFYSTLQVYQRLYSQGFQSFL